MKEASWRSLSSRFNQPFMPHCAKMGTPAMTRFQQVFRILFPIFLGLVFLVVGTGFAFTLALNRQPIWYWPPALAVFALLWWGFRRRWSAWSSPSIFLVVGILVLALQLAVQLMVPRGAGEAGFDLGPPAFARSEERAPIDLSGTFRTLDGKEVSLENFRHKVLFLNVWATWCGPCRAEMPDMADLYRKLSPQGLSMVAVTDEDAQTVRSFLEKKPYPFTVLVDPENILSRRFGIGAIPTTFVIDSQGRLALRKTGSYPWASAEAMESFRELLKQ